MKMKFPMLIEQVLLALNPVLSALKQGILDVAKMSDHKVMLLSARLDTEYRDAMLSAIKALEDRTDARDEAAKKALLELERKIPSIDGFKLGAEHVIDGMHAKFSESLGALHARVAQIDETLAASQNAIQELKEAAERLGLNLENSSAGYFEKLSAVEATLSSITVPTADDIMAIVKPLIPEVKDGRPGDKGDPGDPGRDAIPPSAEELVSAAKEAIMGSDALRALVLRDVASMVLEEMPTPSPGKDGIDGVSPTQQELKAMVDVAVAAEMPSSEDLMEALMKVVESKSAAWALDFERRASDTMQRTIELLVKDLRSTAAPVVATPTVVMPSQDEIETSLLKIFDTRASSWELQLERRAMDMVHKIIDKMPVPKDGLPGKDGRDGIDLDSLEIKLLPDGRTLQLSAKAGDKTIIRSVKLQLMVYKNYYVQDHEYDTYDAVTCGGSLWLATRPTKSKPETDDSWKLIVKRGRDGSPGKKGDKGDKGDQGLPGFTNPFDPLNSK